MRCFILCIVFVLLSSSFLIAALASAQATQEETPHDLPSQHQQADDNGQSHVSPSVVSLSQRFGLYFILQGNKDQHIIFLSLEEK